MIEIDEQGKEWFGYSVGGGDLKDPVSVVDTFVGNLHYVEWFFRQQEGPKQRTLATQLGILFDRLPAQCEIAITDDRASLIRELVHLRNRYVHAKYEEEAPSLNRLQTLSIKVAALISCADMTYQDRAADAVEMTKTMSTYLKRKFAESDRPATVVTAPKLAATAELP